MGAQDAHTVALPSDVPAMTDEHHDVDVPELVARAKAGDRDAIERLVRRYWGKMNRQLARRVAPLRGPGARPDREDLLQDAWIRMVEPGGALDAYDPAQGSCERFLWLVLERTWADRQRRRQSLKRSGERLHVTDPGGHEASMEDRGTPGPESMVEHRQHLQAILKCLKALLSPRDGLLFRLVFLDQERVVDAARALGMSAPRAYKRLHRIRRRARDCRERIEREAGAVGNSQDGRPAERRPQADRPGAPGEEGLMG